MINPAQAAIDGGKFTFGSRTTTGPDGQPRKAPSLFSKAMSEAEGACGTTNAMAASVFDVPVLGTVANGGTILANYPSFVSNRGHSCFK